MSFKNRERSQQHVNPTQSSFGVPYLWNTGYNKMRPPYLSAIKGRDHNRDMDLYIGQPRQQFGDQAGASPFSYDELAYQGLSNRDRYVTTSPYTFIGTNLQGAIDNYPSTTTSTEFTSYPNISHSYNVDVVDKDHIWQVNGQYFGGGIAPAWDYKDEGTNVLLSIIGNTYPAVDLSHSQPPVTVPTSSQAESNLWDWSSSFDIYPTVANGIGTFTIQVRVPFATRSPAGDFSNTATSRSKEVYYFIKANKPQKWTCAGTDSNGYRYFSINYTATTNTGTASREFKVYASHYLSSSSTVPDCYVIRGDDEWQFLGSHNYQLGGTSPFDYDIGISSHGSLTNLGDLKEQAYNGSPYKLVGETEMDLWFSQTNTIGISQYGRTIFSNWRDGPSDNGAYLIFDSYDFNKPKKAYFGSQSNDYFGHTVAVSGEWAVLGSHLYNKYRIVNLLSEQINTNDGGHTVDRTLKYIDGSDMLDYFWLGGTDPYGYMTEYVALGYNKIAFGAEKSGYFMPNYSYVASLNSGNDAEFGTVIHHLHFDPKNGELSERKYHELSQRDTFNEYGYGSSWYNETPEDSSGFGEAVAIGCGRLVVGAQRVEKTFNTNSGIYTANSAGSAYLFDIEGSFIKELEMPDEYAVHGDGSYYFGHQVAVGSGVIAVGAYGINKNGYSNGGNVFIYDLNGNFMFDLRSRTTWPTNIGGGPLGGDYYAPYMQTNSTGFGYSVDVKYGRIAVGAPFTHMYFEAQPGSGLNDVQMTQMGCAFLYDLDGKQTHSFTPWEGTDQTDAGQTTQFGKNVKLGYGKFIVGAGYSKNRAYDVYSPIDVENDTTSDIGTDIHLYDHKQDHPSTSTAVGHNGSFFPFEISPVITPWDALELENGWG